MSLTISNEGILASATQMITAKNTKAFASVDTIVIHYTNGSSALSSAQWLTRPDVEASAHVVVGKKGEIYQIVPFTKIAWHAGKSAYGGRTNFNNFSIGIELDNAGPLSPVGNEFVASFGGKYPANEAILKTHRNEKSPRYWHVSTEEQIRATEELVMALLAKYPTIKHILGHEEIAPVRKCDPGPAFPLDALRNRLLLHDRKDDEDDQPVVPKKGKVAVDKLNIREGAGPDFQKVALPLPLNKEIKIIGEQNGWCKVKVEIEGWVSKAYISQENQ